MRMDEVNKEALDECAYSVALALIGLANAVEADERTCTMGVTFQGKLQTWKVSITKTSEIKGNDNGTTLI